MVYRGRPSKGCHGCRSRKIACDQTRPYCLQCERDGHVCPGYHDTLSLLFQDESLQTVHRPTAPKRKSKPKATKKSRDAGDAQSAGSGSTSASLDRRPSTVTSRSTPTSKSTPTSESTPASESTPTSDSASISPCFWQDRQTTQLEMLRPSYQPTRDEAISWFLRHNAGSGALFMIDFDPGVLGRTNVSLGERTRMASLVAVGSAMLARARRDGGCALQLKQNATREYSRAITLMSQAVTNSVESKSNATLSAVLLLAIFEVITNRTMGTVESWTRHIYGASALLDMRTQEELQNTESLSIFIQLRFQIIISCLQCGLPVPESLLDCNKIAMYLRPQMEGYCDRVIYITGQLANLRAEIISGGLTDTGEILSRAYSMEAALTAWVASAPPEFLYTTIEFPSQPQPGSSCSTTSGCTPPLYNNRYHLYNDLWICHTWNQYRYSRILLCEIIIGCLRRISRPAGLVPGKDLQRQCAGLRKTTRDLALDICASVPYHLGADTLLSSGRGLPASQTYIGAMLLLWPLAVAGATECRGHPVRLWVIECLNIVGYAMGIDQALAVVEIMQIEAGYFEDLDEAEDGSIVFLETDRARNNRFVIGAWSSMLKAC